jgi:hypothetical protein
MSISSSRVPVKQISVWLVLAGLLTGFLVATVNPLILFAAAVAIPLGAWTISSVERALFALIVVIGLLPRFALPVRLGFTPTFLDLAMIGLIAAWIGHHLAALPISRCAARRSMARWPRW